MDCANLFSIGRIAEKCHRHPNDIAAVADRLQIEVYLKLDGVRYFNDQAMLRIMADISTHDIGSTVNFHAPAHVVEFFNGKGKQLLQGAKSFEVLGVAGFDRRAGAPKLPPGNEE